MRTCSKLLLTTALAVIVAAPAMAAGLTTSNTMHSGTSLKGDTRAVRGNVGAALRGNTDADVRSGASYKDSPADNATSGDARVRAGVNTGTNAELGTGTGMGTGTGTGAGMGTGTNAGINVGGGSVGASGGVGAGK